MAEQKKVIVINKPEELEDREFEEGSLLKVEGKILEVVESPIDSGCKGCAFDTEMMGEYCGCALCSESFFKEIKNNE